MQRSAESRAPLGGSSRVLRGLTGAHILSREVAMPIMLISKAKALQLLERRIAQLLEKQRAARDSARSYTYDDYHGIYHSAVALLARLFDVDGASCSQRHR